MWSITIKPVKEQVSGDLLIILMTGIKTYMWEQPKLKLDIIWVVKIINFEGGVISVL